MGLKIEIEEGLFLEGDSKCYILKKYGKDDENYTPLGYFTSLEGVFSKLLKLKVSDSSSNSLKELVNEVKLYRKEVNEILQGV